jgi:GNAT superfamily N-acetyltransferase
VDFFEVHAACDFFERGGPSVNRGLPRFVFWFCEPGPQDDTHDAMDRESLELREAYWDDPAAKAGFCDLLRSVFAIDFGPWDRAGYWDDDYRPFTLFDRGGRAVSSVCLYSMRLVVRGELCTAGQISGVATRPEWRRRGLALRLASQALARSGEFRHRFQYLFADEEAKPLYARLGFSPIDECMTTITVNRGCEPAPGARRLDPDAPEDMRLLHRLACERVPVSLELSALNVPLVMYYALVGLRDAFWWISPLDVVVIARRANGVLRIHDVIGRAIPPLSEIYRYLADRSDREVVLHVKPDRMGELAAIGAAEQRPFLGNNLHVRGAFPLTGSLSLPISVQA